MEKHILEIDSVRKSFDTRLVVSDVWLRCETGDVIGLLGRNGSGKSTLLKIIFGILPADFSFVSIDGVKKSTVGELLKDISYLHQENFIPGNFTVEKAARLSIDKKGIKIFFEDEFIQSMAGKKIRNLSGGELRYLEIKLVLSNPSKFALLDEPYNGLSPIVAGKVNELIRENSKKKGIIVTDHNYENVISISNRLILMRDGKLHHLKDKNELVENGYLTPGMI